MAQEPSKTSLPRRTCFLLWLFVSSQISSFGGGPSDVKPDVEISTIIHQLPEFVPEDVRKLLLPALVRANGRIFEGKTYECFVQQDGAFQFFEIEISVGKVEYFPDTEERRGLGLWTAWRLTCRAKRQWLCTGKMVPTDGRAIPKEEEKATAYYASLPDEKFTFKEVKWEPVVTDDPAFINPHEFGCDVIKKDGKWYASFNVRTEDGLRFDCFGNRPCSNKFLKTLTEQRRVK